MKPSLPLRALALFAILVLAFGAHAGATTLEELQDVQGKVQANLDSARKAVVAIECKGGTASGVIVSPSGLVLTAAHVTSNAGKRVKVLMSDGRSVEARVLGSDSATDAAMVQLPTPYRAWPWAPIHRNINSLKVGDWCFDVGHPGGFDKARGSVVRVGKIVKIAANSMQTDCVLMGGDSGGPLFNLSGEVIGINSQIWQGRDQNQHVSMSPFLRAWDDMKSGAAITIWENGNGGWIGLSTEGGDEGLKINAIAPNSPAAKAGLKAGEILLSIDRIPLKTPVEFSSAVKTHAAGDLVTLKVRDHGEDQLVEVKLGKRPTE